MSNRRNEFQNVNPNPATRFLEWKGNNKCFEFYNKDLEKRERVNLPFRFLVLKEMHTVKGWNDASESGIFSNEVKFIGNEPLNVKSFKGGEIATGLYSEIRSQVRDAGGYYVKSIYIMTEQGEIMNISLKGSSVQEWGEFTKKTRSRLSDEWVLVDEYEEKIKGATIYWVPKFKFNNSLSDDEAKLADDAYGVLEAYMVKYLKKQEEPKEEVSDEFKPAEYVEEIGDGDSPF